MENTLSLPFINIYIYACGLDICYILYRWQINISPGKKNV